MSTSIGSLMSTTNFQAASRTSVELGGWMPALRSPDSALASERNTTDARLRDMERNSGWVFGPVTKKLDNVVGASMRPRIRPNWKALGITKEQAREFSQQVEGEWFIYAMDPMNRIDASRWSNFGGLVRQLYWHRLVDGREAVMPKWSREDGRRYRTTFQVIDPHRISNPYDKPDSWRMRGGVELDDNGAAVAFHVRDRHPGDMLFMDPRSALRWERVPAYTRWGRRKFIYGFERRQADQTMGRSPLLAPLKKIRMLENRDDLELQTAAIQATYAAFIKSALPSDSLFKMLTEAPDGDDHSGIDEWLALQSEFHDARRYTLNGSRIGHLLPGEEFTMSTPERTGQNFTDSQRHWIRYFAQSIGLTYELASGDFSQSAYVGMRAGFNEVWKHVQAEREMFCSTTLTPMFDLWLEEAIETGRIVLPNGAPTYQEARGAWCSVWWIGPGRGSIDPQKEANARKTEMETGWLTTEDALAEEGVEVEDHIEQLAYEERLRQAAGIPGVLASPGGATAPDDREGDTPSPRGEGGRL